MKGDPMNWTPDRPTKPGNVPTNNLSWTKVTERLPPYQENIRVLIYTEGVEFNGVQFFDVPADSLYGDADDLEEAQRHATHWMLLTDLRLPYVEPPDPFAKPVPSSVHPLESEIVRLVREAQRQVENGGDPTHELMELLSLKLPDGTESVPSLRERVEALPDLVLGSGRVIGDAVDRGAVLALLDEVTR